MRALALASVLVAACGGSSSDTPDAPTTPADAAEVDYQFKIFDQIPQFGIYTSTEPNYTPPAGVQMFSYGTVFMAKLTPDQQAMIGSDLAARITYHAQCDNYDRLGGIFFVTEPHGQLPTATDPRVELVRFITPFSDYHRTAAKTLVYPDADISSFANTLADSSKDVWVGIAGGSNPYDGDPCVQGGQTDADFNAVGFKYSLELVSKHALSPGQSLTLTAIGGVSETMTPIDGTFANPGEAISGHVTVIVSGHGPDAGGDEYEYTQDTVTLNGNEIGSFSTKIDCAPYAIYSPDGNPGIFQDNLGSNPRNWCPGALVPTHVFPATLTPGTNQVRLGIAPAAVPSGSYYSTSISFGAP